MTPTLGHEPHTRRRESMEASAWRDISYWLALVATFAAGAFISSVSSGSRMPYDYAVIGIALGALSLGFGVAMLIYRRQQSIETETLRADYADLGRRASALVKAVERMERR